jgi:SAM-dependent methyltransferase
MCARAVSAYRAANESGEETEMAVQESAPPLLSEIKRRQQQMWASGDFHAVAALIQPVAEELVAALDPVAGWRVLDVACGSGNAAIAAARAGAVVVGVDYVPALLERGRRRVEAEGLPVQLLEGDAEAIPFRDASFDAAVSVFGSMFAPDHEQAAAELARVVRPGGRIALATWTPKGFIGEMLKTVASHVPPAPGVASPILWGNEGYLRDLFGPTVQGVEAHERTFTFRFRSADAFVDFFRAYYGPTLKAFEAVGPGGEEPLRYDLIALVQRHSRTISGPVAIPATWLQTIAARTPALA